MSLPFLPTRVARVERECAVAPLVEGRKPSRTVVWCTKLLRLVGEVLRAGLGDSATPLQQC